MEFNNNEFIHAADRATKAIKMVGKDDYFPLFEGLVRDQLNIVTPIDAKTYAKYLETNDFEFAKSVLTSFREITYAAYFVLLIRYSEEISVLYSPYSVDTIDEVCPIYKTAYKPLAIRIKANLDILEEEIVSVTLFEHEENIYSSLDEMWNDVKTLKRYIREASHYKDELNERKKAEDSRMREATVEKKSSYRLQIGLVIVGLAATPFLQDFYDRAKKSLIDSTGSSPQRNVSKVKLKPTTERNAIDSLATPTHDSQSGREHGRTKSIPLRHSASKTHSTVK